MTKEEKLELIKKLMIHIDGVEAYVKELYAKGEDGENSLYLEFAIRMIAMLRQHIDFYEHTIDDHREALHSLNRKENTND